MNLWKEQIIDTCIMIFDLVLFFIILTVHIFFFNKSSYKDTLSPSHIKYDERFQYNITHKIFNHSQIPIPRNKYGTPLIALILSKCKETSDYVPNGYDADIYYISCNNETNLYDARETNLILTFIIETYDNPIAENYIFAHNHEHSWHYIRDLSNQTKQIYKNIEKINQSCGMDEFNYYYFTRKTSEKRINKKGWGLYERFFDDFPDFPTFLPPPIKKGMYTFPCCSTILVPVSDIKLRPKAEYIQIRKMVRHFAYRQPEQNYNIGLLFEFTLSFIVSKRTITPFCPGVSLS